MTTKPTTMTGTAGHEASAPPRSASGRLGRRPHRRSWCAVAAAVMLGMLATVVPPSHGDVTGEGNWSPVLPAKSPPSRIEFGMAYDAVRRNVVVYGGFDGTNNYLSDTWTWDGTDWTERSPATSPPRRWGHAMVYDAARKQVVLFGGKNASSGGWLNDTWTWDGTTWTKHSPPNKPDPRREMAMAYDAARQKVVLFGGEGYPDGTARSDTWTWDGTNWQLEFNVAGVTSPPGRWSHAMAYDSVSRQVLMFGGMLHEGQADDTWTWDGKAWTKHEVAVRPNGRYDHAMAFDPVAEQVVLFAGWGDYTVYYDDTWTWDGAAWTQREPLAPTPGTRTSHQLSYVPTSGKILMFGGWAELSRPNETWTYTLTDKKLRPTRADFDGDAITDVAMFRSSTGQWFVRNHPGFPVTFGTRAGDLPVPGDYDANAISDVAIFRPSIEQPTGGQWFVRGNGAFPVTYGSQVGDLPVAGDYDGDRRTDVAIFRDGSWFVKGNSLFPVTYGTQAGDVPVPADYDGDGDTDVAIFRNGTWFVRNVAGFPVTYGTQAGDVPVPADYDGDGDTDVAVFRPSTGQWFVRNVAGFPVTFGTQTGVDMPVPADYDGDGRTDVAIRRPSTGQWFVRTVGGFPVTYGTQKGDVPLQLTPYAMRQAIPLP